MNRNVVMTGARLEVVRRSSNIGDCPKHPDPDQKAASDVVGAFTCAVMFARRYPLAPSSSRPELAS
jgi:hypothetical protein